MHCSWICGFTFDSPDLDAVPSGLRVVVVGGGLLHCTVLWLCTEHDPGLNVTRISELCTMQTFWEWDSTLRAGNASTDSDVEKIPRGKMELYFYCTVNQAVSEAAAAAAAAAGLTRNRYANQEDHVLACESMGDSGRKWREHSSGCLSNTILFSWEFYKGNVIYTSLNNDKSLWSRNYILHVPPLMLSAGLMCLFIFIFSPTCDCENHLSQSRHVGVLYKSVQIYKFWGGAQRCLWSVFFFKLTTDWVKCDWKNKVHCGENEAVKGACIHLLTHSPHYDTFSTCGARSSEIHFSNLIAAPATMEEL